MNTYFQNRFLLFCLFISFGINFAFGQKIDLKKYEDQKQTQTRIRIASAAIIPKKWDNEEYWGRVYWESKTDNFPIGYVNAEINPDLDKEYPCRALVLHEEL